MNKYSNATLDSISIMALAMGIETLVDNLKIGLLMIFFGAIISLLKYHFRKHK